MSRGNTTRRWPLRQSGLPQSPSKFLCCSRAIGPEPACFRLEKNCQIAAGRAGVSALPWFFFSFAVFVFGLERGLILPFLFPSQPVGGVRLRRHLPSGRSRDQCC